MRIDQNHVNVMNQLIKHHNMIDRPMSKWLSCNISKTIFKYFNTCDGDFMEYETRRKKCKQ